MKCKYIINLPDGETIEVSSSFELIEPSVDLLDEFKKLEKFDAEQKEFLKEITSKDGLTRDKEYLYDLFYDIRNEISSLNSGLNNKQLFNILVNSKNILEDVNQMVKQQGTPKNLEDAVRKWAYSQDVSKKDNVITKKISSAEKEIKPEYFRNVETLNIVGRTSIKQESKKLHDKINQLKSSGLGFSSQYLVNKFIKSINNNKLSENIYAISNKINENDTLVIPRTYKDPEFIFYNEGDHLSLFLGLFKSSALNVDENALKSILTEWNESAKLEKHKFDLTNFSVDNFFAGEFDENLKFIEGEFHKLFGAKLYLKLTNKIIDLVTGTIEENDLKQIEVNKLTKTLFELLNPEKYKSGILNNVTSSIEYYDVQRIQGLKYKQELIAENYVHLNNEDNRDNHWNIKQSIKNKDIQQTFNALKKEIVLGEDLIKISVHRGRSGKLSYWVIPTKINLRNGKIYVEGLFNSSDLVTNFKTEFTDSTEVVEYRKFESLNNPQVYPSTDVVKIDGIPITSAGFINSNVVKKYISRGSSIKIVSKNKKGESSTYGGIVLNATPGKLVIKGKNRILYSNYDNVNFFTSDKLTDDQLKDWGESFKDIKRKKTISSKNAQIIAKEGDFIKYDYKGSLMTNRVVDSDEKGVFILIKTKNGNNQVVKRVARNKIESVILSLEGTIDYNDFVEVSEGEMIVSQDNSIKGLNESYFKDVSRVKNGDIAVIKQGNDLIPHVILDNKTFRAAYLSHGNEVITVIDPENVKWFASKNDISSEYALDIHRVNSWKISGVTTKESNIKYLLPEGYDVSETTLFNYNHLSIGKIIESNRETPTGWVDVTEKIVKLTSKRDGVKYKGLVINKDKKGHIERSNLELQRINYFDKLDSDVKKEYIQTGAYISLYNGQSPGKRVYRVSSISEDNVNIEYSTLNQYGKILTIEKEINIQEIIDNIDKFYLLKGNTKIPKLLNKVKKLENKLSKEEIAEQNKAAIHRLGSQFSEVFGDIKVNIVPSKETFGKNQYAKIKDGEVFINQDNSKTKDVIHEFLHLFLFPLKYKNYQEYENLLLTYKENKNITKSLNLDILEEYFVEDVSKFIDGIEDFAVTDIDLFINAITQSLIDMDLEIPDSFDNLNILEILNTEIKDVLGIEETNSIFMDKGLVEFEPEYRAWVNEQIENNNLRINCK